MISNTMENIINNRIETINNTVDNIIDNTPNISTNAQHTSAITYEQHLITNTQNTTSSASEQHHISNNNINNIITNDSGVAVNLLFCYNCYKSNHISKNCPNPVCSYGVICYNIFNYKPFQSTSNQFSHQCTNQSNFSTNQCHQSNPCNHTYNQFNPANTYKNTTMNNFTNSKQSRSNSVKSSIKYLMVQRKYSFAFFEFLMGKYYILNHKYLQKLFNRMTLYERCLITNYNFKQLWYKLWNGKQFKKKSLQKDFWKASIKFYILKNGFICDDSTTNNNNNTNNTNNTNNQKNNNDNNNDNNTNNQKNNNNNYNTHTIQPPFKLSYFINKCSENYNSPEWYFPKGKLAHRYELPKQCALREFEEETNIPSVHIQLINNNNYSCNVKNNYKKYNISTPYTRNNNNYSNVCSGYKYKYNRVVRENKNHAKNNPIALSHTCTTCTADTSTTYGFCHHYNGCMYNNMHKFEEKHTAVNGKTYKVLFYIAKYVGANYKNMYIKQSDFFRKHNEIATMDWFTYKECLEKFRPYEHEKINLLKIIHTKINQLIN